MKTVETKVYEFDELDDKAKEKAREWYRESVFHDDWWDSTYEDAKMAGLKLESFGLDRDRHATGEFTIPASHVAEYIVANHGEQCETRKTAETFIAACKKLDAITPKDSEGVPVDESTYDEAQNKQDAEFLKSILEDYSIILQKESEYMASNEVVDENIKANGYAFTETGKRFG